MRPLVLCDMDGVLLDFVGHLYHHFTQQGYARPTDPTCYDIKDHVGPDAWRVMSKSMRREGFCAEIPEYPGARDFVKDLRSLAKVIAVTKITEPSPWVRERHVALAGWDFDGRFLQTCRDGRKHLRADFLIDDSPDNCTEWVLENSKGRALLLDRPWNRDLDIGIERSIFRCHTYDQILEVILDYT